MTVAITYLYYTNAFGFCQDILENSIKYGTYDRELKSYDPKASADQELFAPGTGTAVEGIDYLSIMEALSELQTANECKTRWD